MMRERSSPDAGVRVKPLMTLPAINTDASKYGKEQISSIVQEMLVSQHFQDCRGSELTHPSPSGQPTLYCAISSRLFSITTFSFICRCRSWILKPCITTACTIAASRRDESGLTQWRLPAPSSDQTYWCSSEQ